MDTLATMQRKTYHNFLVVRNKLMREKGYDARNASDIAHRIFENHNLDSSRTIKWYYDLVLDRESFEANV